MPEKEFRPEAKEREPKRIIVEIGPSDLAFIYKTGRNQEGHFVYLKVPELFHWEEGDFYAAVDLPPFRSKDTKGHRHEANMRWLKNDLRRRLPEGVRGDVIYGDATELPFANETVDVVYMANVISGHTKDDFRYSEHPLPTGRKALSEKLRILSDIKRVLKPGGKVIIEETYAPAYKGVVEKIIAAVEKDKGWQLREYGDIANESSIFELVKRS